MSFPSFVLTPFPVHVVGHCGTVAVAGQAHTGEATGAAVTADGAVAVTVGDDKTLRVWHLLERGVDERATA